jgi:hypothetical protein
MWHTVTIGPRTLTMFSLFLILWHLWPSWLEADCSFQGQVSEIRKGWLTQGTTLYKPNKPCRTHTSSQLLYQSVTQEPMVYHVLRFINPLPDIWQLKTTPVVQLTEIIFVISSLAWSVKLPAVPIPSSENQNKSSGSWSSQYSIIPDWLWSFLTWSC